MRTVAQQLLPCFAVAALLSGCAQGGAGLVPQPAQISPAASGTHAVRHRVAVRFSFRIPRHHKHARGAKFISPSTTSLQVNVYNSTHTKQLASVTHITEPGQNGCTAIAGGTFTCSFTLNAPIGQDRFDVFAVDGFNGAKLSSIVNFPFTVKQSALNQIKMTLGGIPAVIDVEVLPTNVFQTGSAMTGYQFGGIGSGAAQQLQVTTKDADGNVIVNPGAPTVAITNSAPTKLSVVPVAGTLGRYTLTPLVETNALPSPNPSTAITLTAKATPVGTGTAPISASIQVQNDPIVFGADYDTSRYVKAFAPWSSSSILTIADSEPTSYFALTLDASGSLYVCNYDAGTVNVYPPGSSTAVRTITGLTGPCYPSSIAVDGSGNIFVPEYELDVKEFSRTGGNTPIRTMPNSYPAVALDKSGNLYVANYDGADTGVSVFTAGSTSPTPAFQMTAGMSGPFVPAFDSAGNLYVMNYTAPNVTEYKPPFSSGSTVYKTFGNSSSISGPYGLNIDSAGNVYVASDSATYSVAEYAQAAPTTVVRVLAAGSETGNVGLDQLQNVYVPAYGSGYMYAYPAGTSTTAFNQWTQSDAWVEAVWP